jgi:hypothetical protein
MKVIGDDSMTSRTLEPERLNGFITVRFLMRTLHQADFEHCTCYSGDRLACMESLRFGNQSLCVSDWSELCECSQIGVICANRTMPYELRVPYVSEIVRIT